MQMLKLWLIPLILFLILLQGDYFATSRIHDPINSFFFVDLKTGWITGEDGIFKTSDGGMNWISLNKYLPRLSSNDFDPYGLNDVFINAEVGWILSKYGKILKTMNGGLSWIDQTPDTQARISKEQTRDRFLKIRFINKDQGWVLGNTLLPPPLIPSDYEVMASTRGIAFILKTSDGGRSWIKKDLVKVEAFPKLRFELGNFRILQFLDENNGWLVESNTILETQNGGYTWRQRSILASSIEDLTFVDRKNGWAVYWGKIAHTRDGGNTWLIEDLGEKYLFDKVLFADLENGWVTGSLAEKGGPHRGVLLATRDGGKTWKIQYQEPSKLLFPFFINSQQGWLAVVSLSVEHQVNEYKILHTSDGGQTWIPLLNGSSKK